MRYESQQTQFTDKRSVAETLLDTLTQTGHRPAFSESAGGPQSRPRRLALGLAALGALVAVALIALWMPRSAAPETLAVVELVRGPVGFYAATSGQEPSQLLSLSVAQPIHAGAVVDTGRGTASRTAVRLASGPSVRLDAGTRVRWASSSAMELERGAVYVDSRGTSSVEVRTALGVVRDVGTQFEVRLTPGPGGEESLQVRVREGSVDLESGGESHAANAGIELRMDADGVLTRGPCATHGPSWEWVLNAAPMPEIDGMSLAAFLEWVTREGGWELRFEDDGTAQHAAAIILHGTLEDLTPVEATAAVFQGSELAYRLEAGELVVTAGPGADDPGADDPGARAPG
ncbi:MAG: FecR family protein [Thermoanaerobaculia bacterium]